MGLCLSSLCGSCARGTRRLYRNVSLPMGILATVGVFGAEPTTCPASLIFLDDDPLARDPTVHRLARGRMKLYSVATDLKVLLNAVTSAESRIIQEQLPFPTIGLEDLQGALYPFRELAVLVNAQTESPLGPQEVHVLHELLFEPSRPKWDPFVHNLDFPRDVAADALSDIELLAKSTTPGSAACAVHGLTACGKTTVVKRLAFDLARAGHVVLWLRPWFYQDTQAALSDLFRRVRNGLPDGTRRVIVCMDDPLTFGTLTAQDVVQVLLRELALRWYWSQQPGQSIGRRETNVSSSAVYKR